MTAAVTQAAPDLPPPPDLAIDTDTGQIGTVAELEAASGAPGIERPAIVKPGEAAPVEATKPPPVVAAPVVDDAAALEAKRTKAAADLRAAGAKRRARVAEDASLRGHAQTLEQRLAAEQRARQAAEAQAARHPLDVLKERGEVGQAFRQAAIDEATPEAIARRAEERAAAAERRVAEFEQADARRRQSSEAATQRDRFVQYASNAKELGEDGKPSDVAAFPHVAAHITVDREGVELAADRLIKIAVSRGFRPTWDQVLQELQTRYEKAAALTGAASPAEAVADVAPEPAKAKPKPANGARTLTAKTQERAVQGKRFEDMDVKNLRDGGTDEQLEYIAELARQESRASVK